MSRVTMTRGNTYLGKFVCMRSKAKRMAYALSMSAASRQTNFEATCRARCKESGRLIERYSHARNDVFFEESAK